MVDAQPRACPGTRARPCCRRWTASQHARAADRPAAAPAGAGRLQVRPAADHRRPRRDRARSRSATTVVFSPSQQDGADQDASRPGACRSRRSAAEAGQSRRRHARRADLRRARRGDEPRRAGADREQRLQGAAVLARPPAARGRQAATRSSSARCEAPVTVEAIERVIDTSDLSSEAGRADRAQRRRRGRAAHQAPAGARRAPGRTRSPAASSWSRTTCRSAAASSRWRAIRTSASLVTVRSTNITRRRPRRDAARRAPRATATRAACSGSPASRAPASRPWRWRSSASCSPRATASTCSTATTSAPGLNANLGFSPEDRAENIRRVGEVAVAVRRRRLHRHHGVHLALPRRPRAGAGRGQGRIPRGLRQGLARGLRGRATPRASTSARAAGEIPEFTGISSPYEAPEFPSSLVPTDELPLEDCLALLIRYVDERFQA